jgi:charged multivesicular body protein 5
MARSYDVPEDVDESDLMAELDALEADMSLEEGTKGAVPSYLQVCKSVAPGPASLALTVNCHTLLIPTLLVDLHTQEPDLPDLPSAPATEKPAAGRDESELGLPALRS